MFKIIAPFVILASVFATLNARLGLPPFSLFLMALTLTDGEWRCLFLFDDHRDIEHHSITLGIGMTVAFFFQVTDTGEESILCVASNSDRSYSFLYIGSWFEIGQSITFFCITSLLLVWSAGACALGESSMAETLAEYRVPRVTT